MVSLSTVLYRIFVTAKMEEGGAVIFEVFLICTIIEHEKKLLSTTLSVVVSFVEKCLKLNRQISMVVSQRKFA